LFGLDKRAARVNVCAGCTRATLLLGG